MQYKRPVELVINMGSVCAAHAALLCQLLTAARRTSKAGTEARGQHQPECDREAFEPVAKTRTLIRVAEAEPDHLHMVAGFHSAPSTLAHVLNELATESHPLHSS